MLRPLRIGAVARRKDGRQVPGRTGAKLGRRQGGRRSQGRGLPLIGVGRPGPNRRRERTGVVVGGPNRPARELRFIDSSARDYGQVCRASASATGPPSQLTCSGSPQASRTCRCPSSTPETLKVAAPPQPSALRGFARACRPATASRPHTPCRGCALPSATGSPCPACQGLPPGGRLGLLTPDVAEAHVRNPAHRGSDVRGWPYSGRTTSTSGNFSRPRSKLTSVRPDTAAKAAK